MLDQNPPPTKFQVGDWIKDAYNRYQVEAIAKNDNGWNYVLKWERGVTIRRISEIDEYFNPA